MDGTGIPLSLVVALGSFVLAVIAVAFYANGHNAVAVFLSVVAMAGMIPYMRHRQRQRRRRE